MRITLDNINGGGEFHLQMLKTICGGETENKSMIDLGCNLAPTTSQIKFKEKTYVDILERKLDNYEEQKFFVQYNILDWFNDKGLYYDIVFCLDCIEHLGKQSGYELMVKTTLYSDKQIFFTPLGDYLVEPETLNPEAHKSGWLPEDFEQLGWTTIVLPHYHPLLGIGAFYTFKCNHIEQEFERIKNELRWIK